MKRIVFILILTLSVSFLFAEEKAKENTPKSIYDVAIKTIDEKDSSMAKYKGKVILIVNVASECGFTYQYKGLQEIYNKYKKKNFVILGFPTNDFGSQEPGSNKEIQSFCTKKFQVTFPMFAKITVKGEKKHELYKLLTSKKSNPKLSGKINWNFNKFLISKNGQIIARFGPRSNPEDKEMTSAIEKELTVKLEKK